MPAAEALVVARVLDLGLTLLEVGMNHSEIVDKVRAMEGQGLSAEQIGDALENMRKAGHADAVKTVGTGG